MIYILSIPIVSINFFTQIFLHIRFEGIVVAKENEDVLLDAWRVAEEETARKEKEVSFIMFCIFS